MRWQVALSTLAIIASGCASQQVRKQQDLEHINYGVEETVVMDYNCDEKINKGDYLVAVSNRNKRFRFAPITSYEQEELRHGPTVAQVDFALGIHHSISSPDALKLKAWDWQGERIYIHDSDELAFLLPTRRSTDQTKLYTNNCPEVPEIIIRQLND